MADLDATQAHLVTIQHFGRVYDLLRSRFPDSHGLQAAVGESIRRVVIGWLLQAPATVDCRVMVHHLDNVVDLVQVYDTIKPKDLIDDELKSTIASRIHLAWTELIPREVQRQIEIMETEGGLSNVQRGPSHSVASGSTASSSESGIMEPAKTHGQVSNQNTMTPGVAASGPALSKSESSTTPHPPATSKTDCKGQVSNAETDALTSAVSGRALSSPPPPPATSKTDCKGQVSNAETDALTLAMSGRALSSPKSKTDYNGQVSNAETDALTSAMSGPALSKSKSAATPAPATSKTDCKGQVSNAETGTSSLAASGPTSSRPASLTAAPTRNTTNVKGQVLDDKTSVPAITTPNVGSRWAARRWNIYSFEHPHRPNSQNPVSQPSTSTNVCIHNDTATGPSAAVVPYLLPHLRKPNLGIASSSAAATLSQDHGSKGSMTHTGAARPLSSPSASVEPRNHARIQDVNLVVAPASKTTQLSQGDDSSDPTYAAIPFPSKSKTVSTAPRPRSVRPTPNEPKMALFSPLGRDAV